MQTLTHDYLLLKGEAKNVSVLIAFHKIKARMRQECLNYFAF